MGITVLDRLVINHSTSFDDDRLKHGVLLLEDGTMFEGKSFGYMQETAGEVVFGTGMVGYPEALTDASFTGQILVMTYPLIGNYGVPVQNLWEDDKIHVAGLIVSCYIDLPSHAQSTMNLGNWLQREKIPALEIKDTRLLTQHIRTHGSMLGKFIFDRDIPFVSTQGGVFLSSPHKEGSPNVSGRIRNPNVRGTNKDAERVRDGQELPFYDPNSDNLVAQVSIRQVLQEGSGDITLALIDCGAKRNIARSLLARNVRLVTVPWDYDLFAPANSFAFDGIVVSNGPGNPKMVKQTIQTIRTALEHKIPTLGICLGHQLLALAAGGDTYKLKFGHRSQNQPCLLQGTKRCYITTQNHSYAVGALPPNFDPWFLNANDGSNEGMQHRQHPFLSVQFHPEAAPGPTDTEWIFDDFLQRVRGARS